MLKGRKIGKILCVVTAFVLVVAVAVGVVLWRSYKPMLSIQERANDGVGFGRVTVTSVEELKTGNPWNENMELSTLPVYKNPLNDENYPQLSGGDMKKMRARLLEVVDKLSWDSDTLTVTENELGNLIAKVSGATVSVDQALNVSVSFLPVVSLPERYDFSHEGPYDEADVVDCLKTEYAEILGMKDPQTEISALDLSFDPPMNYFVQFFDRAGGDEQSIISYHFERIRFDCNSDGILYSIWIPQPDRSHKVGDYPIVPPEKATELLGQGCYLTVVQDEFPGVDQIGKVELTYRTGEWNEYFMPYYCFYVEMPETEGRPGQKDYGLYYVPAVEGKYIADMPDKPAHLTANGIE